MTKNKEHLIRKETYGTRVWYPLPNYVLWLIFEDRIAPGVLGSLSLDNKGDWDTENGIYVHKHSGRVMCLAAEADSIVELRSFTKNDIAMTRLNNPEISPLEREGHINRIVSYVSERVAIIHPREYDVTTLSELKVNHFSPKSSHLFVSNEGAPSASIVVDSVPSFSQPHAIPASHPSLQDEDIVEARIKASKLDSPLGQSAMMIDAMFGPTNSALSKFVPTANYAANVEPLGYRVVNYNGRIEILPAGSVRQVPIATFSNNAIGNTASVISNGTVMETTLDGFGTNKDPDRPGSFFFPHPPYLGAMFTVPSSLLNDPKSAAVIITLAIASAALKAGSGNQYSYTHGYKYVNNIIDNEKVNTDLFGGI